MDWEPPLHFDLIFISEVLHLISDLNKFLSKLFLYLSQTGVVAFRTPSHKHLKKIEWLYYFPSLLDIDMRRNIDTEPLIELLEKHGFCFYSLEEIDESSFLPREVYINMISQKSYSILHLLDEQVFKNSLRALESSLVGQKLVKRNMTINLLTAKKRTWRQT